MELREITKDEAYELVYRNHYSVTMPRISKHYLGAFVEDRLVGIVTLGWGTQPKGTINKLFPGLGSEHYYEIGKMCMEEDMPRNSESQMLSLLIKWMKKNLDVLYLYTWADGIVGKAGYVYQAANFYSGGYIWTDAYIAPNGERIHPRTAGKYLRENEQFSGVDHLNWLTKDYMAHKGIRHVRGKQFRYIYPLNNKAKKLLSKSTVEWNLNHPKKDDLVWKEVPSKPYHKCTILTEMPHMDMRHTKAHRPEVRRHLKKNGGVLPL